jgi:predicted ribosome quality control (RQC) complex YloA/Tae2 family protein
MKIKNLDHRTTLQAIADECSSVLRGARLVECFTQQKRVLDMCFELRGADHWLEAVADGTDAALFLRPELHRARKNSLSFFEPLLGARLSAVVCHGHDRMVRLEFEDGRTLDMALFSAGRANIFLCDAEGTIADSFHSQAEWLGKPSPWLLPAREWQGDLAGQTLLRSLVKAPYFWGDHYALDLLERLTLPPEMPFGALSARELSHVGSVSAAMAEEIARASVWRVLEGESEVTVSPLGGTHGLAVRGEYTSASEAVRRCYTYGLRRRRHAEMQKTGEEYFRTAIDKLRRTIGHMTDDAAADARREERRHWADLLMSQPDGRRRGMESIEVTDWDGAAVTIPLVPTKSLVENAEQLYAKVRAATRAAEVRMRRWMDAEQRLAALEEQYSRFCAAADSFEALSEFLDKHSIQPRMQRGKIGEQKVENKYRHFELGGGWAAWAGRNSANNDELTMRFAKPNDYWMHARGVSGSHVVLRGPTGEKPPKDIVRAAAAIAAYYSKYRNAGDVPVAWTQKKYVRKPKGSAVGAVVMDREEVILVRPGLPEGASDE